MYNVQIFSSNNLGRSVFSGNVISISKFSVTGTMFSRIYTMSANKPYLFQTKPIVSKLIGFEMICCVAVQKKAKSSKPLWHLGLENICLHVSKRCLGHFGSLPLGHREFHSMINYWRCGVSSHRVFQTLVTVVTMRFYSFLRSTTR